MDSPTRKPGKKRVRLSQGDSIERMTHIFQIISSLSTKTTEEEKAKVNLSIEDEIKQLLEVHEIEFFIKTYFEIFHDGKIVDCQTRLFVPSLLIDKFSLTKEILLRAFLFQIKKMVNLYADYPGIFKYYGFFIQDWVFQKQLFTLKEIFGWVDLSKEKDEDTQLDM